MNAGALDRFMEPLRRRVSMMVGRAVIALVNDAAKAQELQLTMLADEAHDGVERFQEYGFTSVPLPGAEAAVVFVGGTRSHGIAIAVEDRRYRLKGLQGGEVALYDDQGQYLKLGRDAISIVTAKDVRVQAQNATIAASAVTVQGDTVDLTASSVTVSADHIDLGGAGGAGVARIGDAVANGVITGGSGKVFAS